MRGAPLTQWRQEGMREAQGEQRPVVELRNCWVAESHTQVVKVAFLT